MNQTKTCGPMFLSLLSYFTSDPDTLSSSVRLFSAGHMTGQAEKIYLGACSAAMFRPSPEHQEWMRSSLRIVAREYRLKTAWLRYIPSGAETEIEELWLVREGHEHSFERLSLLESDSPEWHIIRGLLCGVPALELDPDFHLRKGFAQPCDRPGVVVVPCDRPSDSQKEDI